MSASLAELTSLLPADERRDLLDALSDEDAVALEYDWPFWARPNQLPPPGEWFVWLLDAGRGFGKTRTGAEWVRARAESGLYARFALIGETAADVRDVMMEGESGLLKISPPWFMPKYEPSKRRVTWPNGAQATTYSGDEPDQLRGPQHDSAWADEFAKWKYATEAWDNLEFGLRLGPSPQVCVTTTPKPVRAFRTLLQDPQTVVTGGSTYENYANLSPKFVSRVLRKYEGTRLGRQELNAELLEDVPGALWTRKTLDDGRVAEYPHLTRIVVAVDPEASSEEGAAETGIVVAGLGSDGQGYVIADLSLRDTPARWGAAAVAAYHTHRADRLVGEVNNGGEMVGHVIRTTPGGRNLAYTALHASRGKQARAEPIAGLYEQGRVHHAGVFPDLEDQLCNWVPGAGTSPDRLDALVWALTELFPAEVPKSKRVVGFS